MKVKDVVVDMHQGINTVADKVKYLEEGIPIIQSKNFTKGFLDLEDVRFLGKEDEEKYIEKYNPHIGDILMANIGTIGKSFVISEEQRFLIAWNAFLIKPNHEKVQSDFLKFYFDYLAENHFFDNLLTGGTVKFINKTKIGDISLPDKSLNEQNEICIRLSKMEQIIIKREMQLELLDCLIKARFVEFFGDPVTNPMGWDETTIGDECFYIKDGPHKSLPDIGKENGGHPFISVRNIVNGYIDFSTARYISDEDYADAIKKCHPEKGDMLYSKGGTTGIAKLIDIDEEFANWVHVAVLKFDKAKLNGVFFENMLNGAYCYEQSQRLTKGIANRDLVLSAMAQIKMYRPPMELQNQFAEFVKQVDKSKVAVQKSLEETQKLFDSLMQEYFG